MKNVTQISKICCNRLFRILQYLVLYGIRNNCFLTEIDFFSDFLGGLKTEIVKKYKFEIFFSEKFFYLKQFF